MKKYIILFLLICTGGFPLRTVAQLSTPQWHLSSIIPEDSLTTGMVTIVDGLHGYFIGVRSTRGQFSITYHDMVIYGTNDGGDSWKELHWGDIFGADSVYYEDDSRGGFQVNPITTSTPTIFTFYSSSTGNRFGNVLDSITFYRSTDFGKTWSHHRSYPNRPATDYSIEAIPDANHVIMMQWYNSPVDKNLGKLFYSTNGGYTFDEMRWDSTLLYNISYGGFGTSGTFNQVNNHSFGILNDSTWVIDVADSNNSASTSTSQPFSNVVLVSTDAGKHWTANRAILPGVPSRVNGSAGEAIYVKGSSYIYIFTGYGQGGNVLGMYSGHPGLPLFGTNFFVSSDYGKSWKADSSFVTNRRGYAVVAPHEVWCMYTDNPHPMDSSIARFIAHTTNDGATWEIDSTSLSNDFTFDGRTMTFSDPRHGWIVAQTPDRHKIGIFRYVDTRADVPKTHSDATALVQCTAYPDPGNTSVSMKIPNASTVAQVQVTDILGHTLDCHSAFDVGTQMLRLDIRSLTNGTYTARIVTPTTTYATRFIVKHE